MKKSINKIHRPVAQISQDSLSKIFNRYNFNDKQMVLLGESTHGTKEFYVYRFKICKLLIKYDFRWIFFEADWEALYYLNEYIHNHKTFKTCLSSMVRIDKFPLWMIKNKSVCNMLRWFRKYNKKHNFTRLNDGIVFMGLDCYDMFYSWSEVVNHFMINKEHYKSNHELIDTFNSLKILLDKVGIKDLQQYGSQLSNTINSDKIYNKIVKLRKLLTLQLGDNLWSWENFRIDQCLLVMSGTDLYYRKLHDSTANTWNIRDTHWLNMIKNIEKYANYNYGIFKGILWAHNSHVGDEHGKIKHSFYSLKDQQITIGQLVRNYYGKDNVVLVGFSTYSGTVRAAPSWHSRSRVYSLNVPANDTYPFNFHKWVSEFGNSFLILLNTKFKIIHDKHNTYSKNEKIKRKLFIDKHHQRSIGVIYNKENERMGHYSKSNIQKVFDFVIYIDNTNALTKI